MIDIVGRGIRKIFNQQWERRFPMPDYEIDAAKKEVAVRLYGNAINEKYTKLLKENKDLSLEDCILLDAVQKGHRLSESDAKNLLERGLVEGENFYYIMKTGNLSNLSGTAWNMNRQCGEITWL